MVPFYSVSCDVARCRYKSWAAQYTNKVQDEPLVMVALTL